MTGSEKESVKVFLALPSEDALPAWERLKKTLERAGISVIPEKLPEDLATARDVIAEALENSDCSIHIISGKYNPLIEPNLSLSKYQFFQARNHQDYHPYYKVFLWQSTEFGIDDPKQQAFINDLRNNISKNMIFSNVPSCIQLVEDVRSLMETTEKATLTINSTDIFLICNQNDESVAGEISDLLSDIVPVERLTIVPDSAVDYAELCVQQIGKSKLAVVYFKESGDWAVPFVQQVWKKIGGASSHTPILLIGDEDPHTNEGKIFKAPKVLSLIVAGELVPLEIKVHYDKVSEEGDLL